MHNLLPFIHRANQALSLCVFALTLLLLCACDKSTPSTPPPPNDNALLENQAPLIALLANSATPEESRQAADAKLVQLVGPADPTRLAVLEQIVWGPGHTATMRIYALNQIAAADPTRAGRVLMHHLPRMDDWPVLERACALSVELGDLRLVDPLVRSLDRPAKKHPRPERPEVAVIEKLTNQKIAPALRQRLFESRDQSVRIAALDLLSELAGPDTVKKLLREKDWINLEAQSPGGNGTLLADLRWWLDRFDTIPVGGQEVEWVKELRKSQQTNILTQATQRHQKLHPQKDYLIAPRFVWLLGQVDQPTVEMTRPQLLAAITRQLSHQTHLQRASDHGEHGLQRDESFTANAPHLTRCDLLAILILLRGLDTPTFSNQVLEQGLTDMTDTESEHGGVIKLTTSGLSLVEFPPLYKSNDQQYLVSDKLLRELVYGIAEYHFHFQKVHNQDHAGPGQGDLDFAQKTRCNAVVFTSTGPGKFNVDYYTPNGVIVDLGVWPSR